MTTLAFSHGIGAAAGAPGAALVWNAALGILLAAACAADLRGRRIPNALVLAVLAAGLVRAGLVTVGASASAPALSAGLGAALLGVGLGLVVWLPPYATGVLGAGDVKLFAAAGAWLGPAGVLPATLYAALAGGALALAWVARGALAPRAGRDARLPYGLAVAAGVLAVALGGAR